MVDGGWRDSGVNGVIEIEVGNGVIEIEVGNGVIKIEVEL